MRLNKKYLEWAATILSIIGAILNAFLLKEGFYLWIVSDSMWIGIGIKNKMYGLALTFFVFLLISIIGIIYW
jgi:nicotinamide riboside transporter PnuC